ncbi:hypothetical protein P9858_23760 [Niallia circulans]|uniref:hypothetical protein n=1 Tax=Niallia circulans TaxID=1397 RepID=UPI002E1DDE9A|nr:hypothetical protein [Niallia circulans]
MTLKEALNKITFENREYFKYKFPDVRFDKRIPPKTEEELLKATNRKTMNGFLEWEKSPEYANLVALYLQSKMINDIYKIYEVVRQKALEGDDKSVKLLLQLNKEINNMIKASASVSDEAEDDGLEL